MPASCAVLAPAVDPQVFVPIFAAFFVGLIVWVVATALGDVDAEGIRDGGVVATVGNV